MAQASTLAGRGPRRGSRRCPLGLRRRWPAVGAGRLDHPGPPVERHRSERMVCGQRIHSLLLLFFCTPFRAPSSSLTVSLSHWRCPSSPPLPTAPLPPRPRHTQIASQLHVTAASGPTPPGAFPTCHGGGGGQPTPPGPLPPLARQDARLRGRPYRPVSGPGKTRSPPPLDTHLFIAVSCSRRPGCPRGIHHQRGSKRDTGQGWAPPSSRQAKSAMTGEAAPVCKEQHRRRWGTAATAMEKRGPTPHPTPTASTTAAAQAGARCRHARTAPPQPPPPPPQPPPTRRRHSHRLPVAAATARPAGEGEPRGAPLQQVSPCGQ